MSRRDRYHNPGPVPVREVTFVRAIPGMAEQFRKAVPAEFWGREGNAAVVSCVCGTSTRVEGLTSCRCDRFFLFTGREVRVARYPDWRPEAA